MVHMATSRLDRLRRSKSIFADATYIVRCFDGRLHRSIYHVPTLFDHMFCLRRCRRIRQCHIDHFKFFGSTVFQNIKQRRRIGLEDAGVECGRCDKEKTSSREAEAIDVHVVDRYVLVHALVIQHLDFDAPVDVIKAVRDFRGAEVIGIYKAAEGAMVEQSFQVWHRGDGASAGNRTTVVHKLVQVYSGHGVPDDAAIQGHVEEEQLLH